MDMVTVSDSLRKALLQWLANCTIKKACFKTIVTYALLKAHLNVDVSILRQKYNISFDINTL